MVRRNILITGATGFVGSRLAARLVLGTDYNATAVVHRFTGPGLARLSRLPIKLVWADLLDLESLEKAVAGCDIIVHLAYGNAGDECTKREITVSGTENVLKAALKNDVRKVIYFSTAAVHGNAPKASVVDESAPFEKSEDIYRSSKIETEKVVWKYHAEHGLPVVVFRPPLIFGAHGAYWTARIIREIQAGATLVNNGSGAANLIYVDNLIDAVMLAMQKDSGDGEAFIVVDDESLTWRQVYESYGAMLESHPPIRNMTVEEIEAMRKNYESDDWKSWFLTPFLLLPDALKTCIRSPEIRSRMACIPWVRFLKNRLPGQTLERLNYFRNHSETTLTVPTQPAATALPSKDLIDLYSSKARFSNKKIKRILGYKQRISFPEALNLTRAWLKYQRLIPRTD
jgi:nucleoside-diphosphate-sugar epimerase